MRFLANINIMPQDALLDPQGKTVEKNTSKIGLDNISNIRIGKRISLQLESNSKLEAEATIKKICEKLLVNQITEQYTYELTEG